MTNCKNKLCFLPHVAVSMAALCFITSVAFICSMSVSSVAQQNAPVNLLTIAPVDKNTHSADSPNNIDQAIEQALETDGSIKRHNNKKQSEETVKPTRMGEVITNKSLEGLPIISSSKDAVTADAL